MSEAKPSKLLFLTCFLALIATSFGFISRAFLLEEWAPLFQLSETQKGEIFGAGLWPFAISIVLFSLVVDRIGYGKAMWFAVATHLVSAVWTVMAKSYSDLYWAAFIGALGNGTIEAVINPVIATVFRKNKTQWLNILHAGWPAGLVLAGSLTLYVGAADQADLRQKLMELFSFGESFQITAVWQLKVVFLIVPVLIYALLLPFCRFPQSERVAAKVPYRDMLAEAGGLGIFIVSAMVIGELGRVVVGAFAEPGTEIPWLAFLGAAGAIGLIFAVAVRSLGRPLYILMLLVMLLLATTELGIDGWVPQLMKPVVDEFGHDGGVVLIYTSAIMMVLRFLIGPILSWTGFSPVGLLAASSFAALGGLLTLALAGVGSAPWIILVAVTIYGIGKTFFWPTTLGYIAEQFPRGGALTLNAIAGVGMLGVGILGGPWLGYIQDTAIEKQVRAADQTLYEQVIDSEKENKTFFGTYHPLNAEAVEALPDSSKQVIDRAKVDAKSDALLEASALPAIMLLIYLALVAWHRSRGGYAAKELTVETPDE